jgi:hypothetical protein
VLGPAWAAAFGIEIIPNPPKTTEKIINIRIVFLKNINFILRSNFFYFLV